MKRMTIATVALCLASGLSQADVVTVQGTGTGYYLPPTGYMTALGSNLHPGGHFRFGYSYQTGAPVTTGTFKLESLDADGNVLDSFDINPAQVFVHEEALSQGGDVDEYFAASVAKRNGVTYQLMVGLVDRDGGTMPADPSTYLNHPWEEMLVGIGIDHPDCSPNLCYGFLAYITGLSGVVTPGLPDEDGDGIADSLDKCAGSSSGAVNGDGCTIAQLVPCSGPKSGGAWKNHGQYVGAVAKAADAFLQSGLITAEQKDAIVAAAAGSGCGQ